MTRLLTLCLAALILLTSTHTTHAQTFGEPNINVTLEAETYAPKPGSTVTVAVVMKPGEGWHDYWLNPGGAGTPLELEWDLPEGVTAGEIRAPVPKLLWIFGIANYVYERDHAFLIDLKIADNVAPGTQIPIRVLTRWSECTDRICVPGEGLLALNLTIGDGQIAEKDLTRFDIYRSDIPLPLDQKGRYAQTGDRVQVAIPFPATAKIDQPYFFPVTGDVIDYSAPQIASRSGDWLVMQLVAKGTVENTLTGLLRIGKGAGLSVELEAGDIPVAGDNIATLRGEGTPPDSFNDPRFSGAASNDSSLILILAAALLGGLLLNLMPCVFPILGLKALSLAKMGGDERAARRDALGYTAGIIVMCLALGGIMLALRAGGEQVGWAFQLQEPRIVLLLFLLMVIITANLAGLFEINIGMSGKTTGAVESRFGSFGTGVLAAIIATPCTGPFMAAALGAALLLPAWQALMLFAVLGLGLALPYLAIAYIPSLRKRLPKPGPWLETFRKWMAVPMGLTTVALAWLLWRLSGDWGALIALVGLIAMFAAMLRVRSEQKAGKPATGGMLAVGLAALALFFFLPAQAVKRDAVESSKQLLGAESYSDERLAELRSEGRAVFVYFTADWCVTCKVNEAAAINRDATAKAFKDKNIAVLVGDFTRKQPAMARILARHGSAGVPLYLWYAPGAQSPEKLPQILTPAMLQELGD